MPVLWFSPMAGTSLHSLLNELFGAGAGTNAAQAKALAFDAARLSRLRTGSIRLTDAVANRLADKLAALGMGETAKLRARLLAAAKETPRPKLNRTLSRQPASIQRAVDLFNELARPGAFLAVEYRDWPVTPTGGPYGEIGELAGKAIAHGLSFAMFLPFRESTARDRKELPARVWRYRDDLVHRVREIYREILAAARRAHRSDSTQYKPDRQLVLYERVEGHSDAIGFQSRLFYAVIPVDGILPRREIWEWVAVPDPEPHAFLRRSNLELDVIYRQFFEVTAFWQSNGSRLPGRGELQKGVRAAIDLGWFDIVSGSPTPKAMWEVSTVCEKLDDARRR